MSQKKIIPEKYYNELVNSGSCVPRHEKNGDVMTNFIVGHTYNIGHKGTKETVAATCIQDCPYNLRLIK